MGVHRRGRVSYEKLNREKSGGKRSWEGSLCQRDEGNNQESGEEDTLSTRSISPDFGASCRAASADFWNLRPGQPAERAMLSISSLKDGSIAVVVGCLVFDCRKR